MLNLKSSYRKAISLLVGGAVLAQIINVISLPILTRLYSPNDFAILAMFMSAVLILSPISCLRFEVAIPIPEGKEEAVFILAISVIANIIFALLILILILFFYSYVDDFFGDSTFVNFIWLVPLAVLFIGFYNIFQYWSIREKKFSYLARVRIFQSLYGSAFQILIGVFSGSAFGLIVGNILKLSLGFRYMCSLFYKEHKTLLKAIVLDDLKKCFKKNDKYPKYSTVEAVANSAGIHLPIIIIGAIVGGAESGFLMIAIQLMSLPITFFGGAVSQVYLSHGGDRLSSGELSLHTRECIALLLKIGFFPILGVCLVGPYFIPYLFGEEWSRTGSMLIWMFPWFMMQLLVSPVSMALYLLGMQKQALYLQVLGLIIRVLGLLIFGFYEAAYLFEYYAVSSFIFYSLYLLFIIFVVKGR